MSYAGDKSVELAWSDLVSDPDAVMVDVRTKEEWNFVGVPDMSAAGKELVCVEWQSFPSGSPNPDFVQQVGAQVSKASKLYFLCRSGSRSRAAAIAMTTAGFSNCFNITEGFEGNIDDSQHRGVGGWKAAGLPWFQS